MSESQKRADKKYYEKKIANGWIKFSKWIHKDKIESITAEEIQSYVDSKANRRELINTINDKGEVE